MYVKKFTSFSQVLKRWTQKKIGSFFLPRDVVVVVVWRVHGSAAATEVWYDSDCIQYVADMHVRHNFPHPTRHLPPEKYRREHLSVRT